METSICGLVRFASSAAREMFRNSSFRPVRKIPSLQIKSRLQ